MAAAVWLLRGQAACERSEGQVKCDSGKKKVGASREETSLSRKDMQTRVEVSNREEVERLEGYVLVIVRQEEEAMGQHVYQVKSYEASCKDNEGHSNRNTSTRPYDDAV